MIFTERTIKISNGVCEIDNPIVLYRGDYNVEVRFTIIESPFKYTTKNSTNIIEDIKASYGQLVIKVPNDGLPIFSDVVKTNEGSVVFTISGEMIDESIEVGDYTFQIRLFDANKESRATIPPIENGISIREPIAFEDVTTTNEVGEATVGYALTTAATPEDAFDSQGNYNKTTWGTGDRITAAKLNKIEAGIDGVNKKVASGGTSGGVADSVDWSNVQNKPTIPTKTSQLTNDSGYITNVPDEYITEAELNAKGYATTSQIPTVPTNVSEFTNDAHYASETFVNNKIAEAQLGGGSGTVDLSGYVTKETGNASQITFADGQTFQAKLDAGTLKGDKGDKGDVGPQGPQGIQGPAGTTTASSVSITDTGNYFTATDVEGALQEVSSQIKEIMNSVGSGNVSSTEPGDLDMPKVFFYGDALPTTKDNVNLTMDYISNTDKFTSYVKLKCQGTSSMSYAKKNFTIDMYSDEARTTKFKKDFKGWEAQSKFCLKANYVDTTHTRNISGARIAYDMVQSRPDSAFKQQLLTAPRGGAVDGFPIKLYFNGEFYGIYTWNIPKDGWMFNMDSSNPNHMVLCAEQNNNGTATDDNVLRCEFRKEWDGTDGNSWSIEFGTYSDALKNSFNRCVNFIMTATDEQFKTNIGQYFDLYSLLDYYCFAYFTAHIDGLAKNMLMITYDGVIWGAGLYDMDSIYGADWNGTSFKAANIQCPEQYQETNSLLWQRIEQCFATELYARYLELRQGALSLGNIIKHVEGIYDVIPDRVFADEKAKWTDLPSVSTNTMTRFRNYMRDRAVYVDAQMKEIATKIPCTGISLDKDTLTFDLSSGGVDETISTTYTQGYLARNKWAINNGAVFGEVKSSTSDITTDYIPCDSNTVFVTTEPAGNNSANHGVVAYDSNKQALYVLNYSNQVCTWYTKDEILTLSNSDSLSGIVDSTITINNIPSDVAYIRCSFATASEDNVTIVRKGSINTQTLTATVEPSNTTDVVTWSVSPTGVVTVNNGVVTPVANGDCTITATCGSQSATCAVTVSGINGSGGSTEPENILQTIKKTDGYYNDVGVFSQWGNLKTTDYIDMPTTSGRIKHIDETAQLGVTRVSYFDENKTYLGYNRGCGYGVASQGTGLIELDMDKGAKYFVVSSEDFSVLTYEYSSGGTPGGGDTGIYATAEYAITEPRTFNGTSDYIDTGIQLFDTAKDFALYIDYTPTAGITQANNTTVFHCLHEVSPYRGLCMMLTSAANVYFIGGQSGSASYAGEISPFDNHKFIIQFANGVISSIKTVNGGLVQDVTLGATAANNPYVQVTENLLLGCYQDISGNKERYWNGTINKFGVWYKQLTNDEIKILTGCDSIATDADITIQTTYTNGYIARSSKHLVVNENVSLGEIIISTGDITSDFISCKNTDTFTINVPQTQYGCGVVAYDSSQSYLNTYDKTKSWSYSPTGDVDIKETTIDVNNLPENTAYIRICVNTTDSSSVTIIKHSIVYS